MLLGARRLAEATQRAHASAEGFRSIDEIGGASDSDVLRAEILLTDDQPEPAEAAARLALSEVPPGGYTIRIAKALATALERQGRADEAKTVRGTRRPGLNQVQAELDGTRLILVTVEQAASAPTRRRSRRAEILEIAVGLFAARGYHGVSMDDIGAAAGVTGPALYHHFAGKEAMPAAALNPVSENLLAAGPGSPSTRRTPPPPRWWTSMSTSRSPTRR